MKVIYVPSCKECPYRSISYSFASGHWTLSCQYGKTKATEFKEISKSRYVKTNIKYEIPDWCGLKEVK